MPIPPAIIWRALTPSMPLGLPPIISLVILKDPESSPPAFLLRLLQVPVSCSGFVLSVFLLPGFMSEHGKEPYKPFLHGTARRPCSIDQVNRPEISSITLFSAFLRYSMSVDLLYPSSSASSVALVFLGYRLIPGTDAAVRTSRSCSGQLNPRLFYG